MLLYCIVLYCIVLCFSVVYKIEKKEEFEYVVNQIPDVRQYQIELTGVASAFSKTLTCVNEYM